MNKSLADIDGEMLIISQFTLYGDCRKGRRPGFSSAAAPEIAEPLYRRFIEEVKNRQVKVATGIFQASMEVELVNDGPVTLLLDSEKQF
jgi:D-tyrosyl-tRNA(Tyr) deacylase